MEELKVNIACTPASHLCHADEPVTFHITANKSVPLKVTISIDSETTIQSCEVIPPAQVTASLPFPGFLRCAAKCDEGGAECGVGVDPDQIRTLMQEPEDFDTFWENSFKELEAIPADFKMPPCEGRDDFDIFRLDCANVNGLRAYAMFALPKKREKKVPLYVIFGGGEAYVSEKGFGTYPPAVREQMGVECAVLYFQLPPYPPVVSPDDSKSRHEEFLKEIGLPRYVYYGLDSPKKFYAYPAILGCVRLLDIAAELPEINKEAIIYCGSSHGGGFGIYLACFSKHIKAAFCGVPNFGDIAGFLAGRHPTDSNAPQFRGHVETRKYFDAAFCAKRITIPVYMSAGFIDSLCAPTAVYSIYNNLAGPKFIFNKIDFGHGGGPREYRPMFNLWLSEHLKELIEKSEADSFSAE